MGPSNSKQQVTNQPKADDQVINHERFKTFKFLQKEELIEIMLEIESEKDVQAWQNDLKKLDNFEQDTLLLPKKHIFTSKGFCGNLGNLKMQYDNFPYLFEEEVDNRIEMKRYFDEEQLWYLLYCLVSSAHDFSKIESKIGDVRPYNIFINEEGQIKVANLFSWPFEKSNFDKSAFQKQVTYLSPEEVACIGRGSHENTTNKMLSQSFSIGLTLLQAAVLFDCKQLYSIEKWTFDTPKLQQKLSELQNLHFYSEAKKTNERYSDLLQGVIRGLCEVDAGERQSSLGIQNLLRPHSQQILNLVPFNHEQVNFFKSGKQNQVESEIVSRPYQLINIPQQVYKTSAQVEPKVNGQLVKAQEGQYFGQSDKTSNGYQQYFHKYSTLPIATNFQPVTNNNFQPTPIQTNNFQPPNNPPINSIHQYPQTYVLPTENRYQQIFHKYATGSNQPPTYNSQPISAGGYYTQQTQGYQQGNALNIQPHNLQPPSFIQSQLPNEQNYTSIPNFTFQQTVSNYQPINPSKNYESRQEYETPSSDILRKIDEQLQNSRKLFPS